MLSVTSIKRKFQKGSLSMKSYTTINLLQHLYMKHVEIHKQYSKGRQVMNQRNAKENVAKTTIPRGDRGMNEGMGY